MAVSQGFVDDAHDLIQGLYTTGDRSDLFIRAAKKGTKHYKEFKVHKCIVYPAIPVLERIEVKNRSFTVVNLAEPSTVVDAMLRHVYKLPIECVPLETDSEEENVQLAIELRKAAAETQFDLPSLFPLTELIIGNSLQRIVHRTFEPQHVHTSSRIREAEKSLPEGERLLRRKERELAQVQAAKDRPLVDFAKIVVALEKRNDDESCHPFRLAALFILATMMPKVMSCGEAVKVLKNGPGGFEFYREVTEMAFHWLSVAKRDESAEDRRAAAKTLFEESQTGTVEVEEPEAVMDFLFRFMYNLDIEIVPKEGDSTEQLAGKAKRENFYLAMSVEAAANKYLLAGIDGATFAILYNCVYDASVGDLVSFARSREEQAFEEIDYSLVHCILMLGREFKELLACKEAWDELYEAPKLLKIVAQCATHIREHSLEIPDGAGDWNVSWMIPFLREAGISLSPKTTEQKAQRSTMDLVYRMRKDGD
ncbi:hypothetical protein PRZ48_011008 [Zasmidium cellare]|uniref:BTB domain-containing protein n=1 Tax=Zasmidium cellare TaxID=395010 RepID=A0ABR0EA86_ZASCE|nr:hypothetical protein PRZ48_011008 [Zasmidium cellare]